MMPLSKFNPRLLLLFATGLGCFEHFFLGSYSFVDTADTLSLYIPRYSLYANYVTNLGSVNWLPEIGMGIDRNIVDVQPWHISTLLSMIFTGPWAHIIVFVFCLYHSSFYCYLFLTNRLNLGKSSGLVGGVIFLFYQVRGAGGQPWFVTALMVLTVVAYYCFPDKHDDKLHHIKLFLLSLILALFSTLSITLPYIVLSLLLLVVVLGRMNYIKLYELLIIVLPLVVINYPQFEITHEAAQFTDRISSAQLPSVYSYIINVSKLVSEYSFPLVPAVAVYYITTKHRHLSGNKTTWLRNFILISCSVMFLATLEPHRLELLAFLPSFVSSVSLGRLAFVMPLFAAILVALTFELAAESLDFSAKAKYHVSIIVLLLIGCSLIPTKIGNLRHLLYQQSAYLYTKNQDLKTLMQSDQSIYRVAVIGGDNTRFRTGIAHAYGFETIGGHSSLPTSRFNSYWRALFYNVCGNINSNEFVASAASTAPCVENAFATMEFEKLVNVDLLGFANVKYIISLFELRGDSLVSINSEEEDILTFPPNESRLLGSINRRLFQSPRIYIYRNATYRPRLFLAENVKIHETDEDLFDELERSTAESLSHTVLITDRAANGMRAILEGRGRDAVQNKDAETHGTVELKVTKYSPDSIEVSVSLPHPRMLVVTNNYSPFWRAYVNGVDTAIIPTYGSFWGVALAEGQHHVVFQYEP